MIINDCNRDISYRNCASRAIARQFRLSLYHPAVRLFGQQLISQEILLLPLIYRAKLSDVEACLGKSPYNWFPEKGCTSDTVLSFLSFPSLPLPLLPPSSTPPPCNSRRPLFQSSAGKFTMKSRRRILLLKLLLPHNFHLLRSPYVENYILCGYCPRHGICL